MNACQCAGPGHCPVRDMQITRIGHRICKAGDPQSIAAYFGEPGRRRRAANDRPVVESKRSGGCAYLGPSVRDAGGNQVFEDCSTCRGNVRLKVFACTHPGHAAHPTTTDRACQACKDWTPKGVDAMPKEDNGALPVRMVAPSMKRPGIWRGGIIQVMVTRACDQSCFHCTQGSNLSGGPVMMTVEQFDEACASLEGYFGVVGMFGGNPAMHPQFGELCKIMRSRFPLEQRGLWCNNLMGKGAHARVTFNPRHSNINVHLDSSAAEEFRRDWPEAAPFVKGEHDDSGHGSPWVAMRDVIPDEAERWKLIGDCDINKYWSAMICVVRGKLRAFFCEIAGAQAMLHEDNPDWCGTGAPMPDTGLPVTPGWWRKPMAAFEAQAREHCHACGIPLRRPPELAIGGEQEEFSATHAHIARPKRRGRPVSMVETIGPAPSRPERPSTQYLAGVTPGYHGA